MSATFVAASSQYLLNSTPAVLDYPLVVGMWCIGVADATVRSTFALADTGTTTHYLRTGKQNTDVPYITAGAGGVENALSVTTAITTGQWYFYIGRFISSTNRRLAVRFQTGVVEQNSVATARAPLNMDAMSIGARVSSATSAFWDGKIAEFWIANADIADSAADLPTALVHQLAFGGPFSVSSIAQNIVEYHSLLDDVDSASYDMGHDYFTGAYPVWVNNAGVTVGDHPPLPYWYVKPAQRRLILGA